MRWLDWGFTGAAGLYVLAVAVAQLTATWFVPTPLGTFAVGTLAFGITFTQRDRVHRYGRPAVYAMLGGAALVSALESVFLGVPWRIIAASVTAILLAEAADTEVFHRVRRRWLVRVAASNAVSVPLDSLLFTGIAFAGVLPWALFPSLLVGETLLKWLMGGLAAVGRASRG